MRQIRMVKIFQLISEFMTNLRVKPIIITLWMLSEVLGWGAIFNLLQVIVGIHLTANLKTIEKTWYSIYVWYRL